MQSRDEGGKHLSPSIHLRWKIFILSLNLALAIVFTYCLNENGLHMFELWNCLGGLGDLALLEKVCLWVGLVRFQSTHKGQSHSLSNLGIRM